MKSFLKAIAILLLIFFALVGGAYAYFKHGVWNNFYDNELSLEEQAAIAEQEEFNRAIEQAKGYGNDRPFVYLIAGIDTHDVQVGRTDALLVAFVDTKEKDVQLLSLPRDLRVEIPGYGIDKINAAYAYGGISLTKQVVSNYLDVPIDQYFVVNFDGFAKLIDTIGGLTIDVEKDMRFHDRISNKWVSFSKGVQTLDGHEALNYARFRKDSEGDFGRMRRQQQVISELASQGASFDNVGKIGDIINVLGNNMRTSISFDDATKLAVSFVGINKSDISSIDAKSYPATISGVSYVVIDEYEQTNLKLKIEVLLKREDKPE